MLRDLAARAAGAIALRAPGRPPLSYGRLWQHLEGVALALAGLGVRRHDRVAVVLPPGPETAVAFLAVAARATCAPLNPAYRASEFEVALTDLKATAVLLQAGVDSPARSIARARGLRLVELSPTLHGEAGVFALLADEQGGPAGMEGARPEDVALVLQTSGTTSRPKIVPLTHENICASAANMRLALDLHEQDCCLNLMPPFHIHGLMATLASLLAGASVACLPPFDPGQFFAWMDELRPTWYTAAPTIHQAILGQAPRHRETIARARLRFIRSSSAPLPPPVMAELERVFAVPVIEAYGMTEACHQIASNPLPPGERKPGSVGLPAGTEVAIVDAVGRPVPVGETGEIVIRGANVTWGYENNPEATGAVPAGGWISTGDQGRFDDEGYLFLTGRLKEIINRGGEKISPREVDDVLMEHPAVAEAATFPVPHPTLGEDVAAAVVLRRGLSVADGELHGFTAARLADFKVPAQILILDGIPKGPTGKVQRQGLGKTFGLVRPGRGRGPAAAAYAPPRTPEEETLARIWGQVLKCEPVGIHDNFFALGGDSLLATLVLSRIRDAWDVELPQRSLFEAPTLAGLAGRIASARQEGRGRGGRPLLPLPPGGEAPLSFAQERLWLHRQLEPESPLYNVPAAFRLAGPLDVTALARSLQEVVDRHGALRTSVSDEGGRPLQVVAPAVAVPLPVIDLRAAPPEDREIQAVHLAAQEARRPFDLAHAALLRALLLRLADEDHILILTLHHLGCDGWSMGILSREMAALYGAFTTGEPSPLPGPIIQYRDFAVWQRAELTGEGLERSLAYWRGRLDGAPAVLELPTDRPRPPAQTFRGARESLVLPKALSEAIVALGRREGATLFMTLLAAYQTLLHRYTGQDDIVVGSPIAGRTRAEVEPLIGCFVNTLALRTDLSGDPTFRELLGRVREAALGDYTHQELPFEKLVEALRPARDPSRSPLFQAMFVLENTPAPAVALPGLAVRRLEIHTGTALFDLILSVEDTEAGLKVVLEYNTDLFEPPTMTRLLGHFQTLLEGIAADPDQRLAALPLLTEGERHQLVVAWNATRTAYPREACLHELFAAQAARTPEAVAVVFEETRLTYRALDGRANQLAHHLRRLGVGPDVPVGLCLERSPELVVGLLGILKAGGAYLPLDPADPTERLAYMLGEARAPVVVTQAHLRARLPAGAPVLCLDADGDWLAGAREGPPAVAVRADHLAYVMYTSGSTGTPKGVAVPHRAVARLVCHTDYVQFTPADVVAQASNAAFDAATFEIWGALLHGARLVILPPEVVVSPPALAAHLARHQVTVLFLTPALFHQCARDLPTAFRGLRDLVLGGEAPDPRWVAEVLRHGPPRRLLNGYGPTESTTFATWYHVAAVPEEAAPLPIGRPIANTECYVLDPAGQLVPVGVPGELYLGGDGLARGYWQRPDLTAERFVPHPFSADPRARLYRTGDRVRYRPDGTLEFLGRFDDQVKIRGFRVEPGEIAAALTALPEVREAVVVAREEASGDRRLVAYVVLREPSGALVDGLRAALKAKLPDYMIPSAFVVLDALPLTANGKVDRWALPAPDLDAQPPERPFVAPRTPVEEVLAGIWAAVLGRGRVGVHDDFFALGGHSLLATQVMARVREAFGVELPLRRLFEAGTVAGVAAAIIQAQAARADGGAAARMLADLEALPEKEAEYRLAQEMLRGGSSAHG